MIDKFDLQTYIKPFYEGNIIHHETCLFLSKEEEISLLFPIKRVISVRNYGLDKEFIIGKDYEVTKAGNIRLLPNSEIPTFGLENYYLKTPNHDYIRIGYVEGTSPYHFNEQRYIRYEEQDAFTKYQITITYEHDSEWEGIKPISQKEKVSKFLNRLINKEPTNILFYGDSITTGCNSSGTDYGGNVKPFAPSWGRMVTMGLEERFNTKINYYNTAVGGMTTKWGADNVVQRVTTHNPHLVVIAFGMNDGLTPIEEHMGYINTIISECEKRNPDVEFVLVSSTCPNIESAWFGGNQHRYIEAYKALNKSNVAVVDMSNMHLDLLKRKSFKDMTGNNVNHPNDFLARVYAQSILETLK